MVGQIVGDYKILKKYIISLQIKFDLFFIELQSKMSSANKIVIINN